MKPVFQVTLCLALLAAALPAAALAAEEFSRAGLIFWLKPDAGITKDAANKITAWQDQSGAGSHAAGEAATAPVFTTEGTQSFAHFDADAGNFLTISKPVSAAPVREASAFIARGAPVLQGLQLRLPGSGVCAIDIFTPRGARAGSFQLKAPGAFDLSQAGLSNGVYQIRVRAGADIFWLKAPVVR